MKAKIDEMLKWDEAWNECYEEPPKLFSVPFGTCICSDVESNLFKAYPASGLWMWSIPLYFIYFLFSPLIDV